MVSAGLRRSKLSFVFLTTAPRALSVRLFDGSRLGVGYRIAKSLTRAGKALKKVPSREKQEAETSTSFDIFVV
ncbi:hypothetical protein F5B19DRAFT_360271 [Rostrohypoxylon terebratum]|nr:hypothetical protein F5B19DRAFT_360271 [Rostrohypoxylon terebratum]